MKIKLVEDADRQLYKAAAAAYGGIFHSPEFLSIYGKNLRIYGIYDDGGNMIGGFHLYHRRQFGLSVCVNPPFNPTIGPFLKVECNNPVSVMETWKKALTAMAGLFEEISWSILSVSLGRTVTDTQPFLWNRFKVSPEYTYVVDLSRSESELWDRLASTSRRHIKKAVKDGLAVMRTGDKKIIRDLVLKTFSRQNESLDCAYLDKILFEFASPDNSYAFAAFRNGIPVSCTFCIFDRDTAYYLLGGYDHENRHNGAGGLCMWESIRHARGLGLTSFDFEGSMIPRIEKFFRGFGGRLSPYYRVNKAVLPLEILLKFYKRELF